MKNVTTMQADDTSTASPLSCPAAFARLRVAGEGGALTHGSDGQVFRACHAIACLSWIDVQAGCASRALLDARASIGRSRCSRRLPFFVYCSGQCYVESASGSVPESRSMPQEDVPVWRMSATDRANIHRQATTGMQTIILASKSGQHATVVTEAAKLSGKSVKGFLAIDDDMISIIPDCDSLGKLSEFPLEEFRNHAFVVACGSNQKRKQIVELILMRGGRLESVVHPSAIISPSATIGSGSMILAGAVVGPSAVLGLSCIVNHCASVDHHCRLGDYVNVSPGARLGGAVELDDEVFLGLNASILPGTSVGAKSTIGAGAVVLSNVPASSTMVGVPAVPVAGRP